MLRFARLAFVPFFGLVAVAACSSSDDGGSARAALASGCNINSDCTEPLVCAFRKCHTACEVTYDCPSGQRCMASDRPFHVCQLPDEQRCSYNSQCPRGQACGIDGECRDQCSADRDCVRGQRCVTGTCAEPSELDADGGLPVESDASPEVSGQPCSYSSDCSAPFVCRGGLCAFECLEDRDCKQGRSCGSDHRCQAQLCGGHDPGVRGGKSCSFDSECEAPLVCHAGRCDCQCIAASDCEPGEACVAFQCVSAAVSDGGLEGAAGGSVEADAAAEADAETEADAEVAADAGADAEPDIAPDAGADAGAEAGVDAGSEVLAPPATSCLMSGEGLDDCGGSARESCCTTLLVTGGDFRRDYDGVTKTDADKPATISDFQLDKYEVTVGRFRQFVAAWLASEPLGWRPKEGDGKHAHLNGREGLKVRPTSDVFETGWQSFWTDFLPTDIAVWDNDLTWSCTSDRQQWAWTSSASLNERLPINCVDWYEAYAFCIWDGGFLPSEAEWNYAAAGGDEQRVYPWSSPPEDTAAGCSYANYYDSNYCSGGGSGSTNAVGSESPLGDGRFGQVDLAGNVAEWVADSYFFQYQAPCVDCAYQDDSGNRWVRGGSAFSSAVTSSSRMQVAPGSRSYMTGFRCARVPKNAP